MIDWNFKCCFCLLRWYSSFSCRTFLTVFICLYSLRYHVCQTNRDKYTLDKYSIILWSWLKSMWLLFDGVCRLFLFAVDFIWIIQHVCLDTKWEGMWHSHWYFVKEFYKKISYAYQNDNLFDWRHINLNCDFS